MKETLIDIETYCEADIKKCGLYRYVSDPSFEILLIAWATDEGEGFGETKLADLASGDPFPKELLDDFKDSDVTLIAHNAAFERVSFSRYLQQHYPGQYLKPGTFLSPDNWICTMVMAASLTLPMALKDVGEVLRTTQQKDEEGKRLIKLFSAPCKPTKSNGGRTRNLPHHLPEDWAKFKYYCIQDVNTEVDIYKRLKRFPMPAREWHHYRVNERINDRGVRIDTELVQQAITCDLLLSDAMTTKAYELTGLENPNSVSQLKTWLDERGISMDTLGKKNVTEMIGELDRNGVDAEAMDMLKLRLQMAKSSVKKYQAAERCVCPDGRARGLFQFYGASRTGRYSGRNIQLQNLPQNHISTLDEARTLERWAALTWWRASTATHRMSFPSSSAPCSSRGMDASSSWRTSPLLKPGCLLGRQGSSGCWMLSKMARTSIAPQPPRCSMSRWSSMASTVTCARKGRSQHWPAATAVLPVRSSTWVPCRWD